MSALFAEISRNNELAIRQALTRSKQCAVAEAVDVSARTLSRWVSGEGTDKDLAQVARLLAALGLKVVPLSHEMFDPAQMEALLVLAKRGLSTAKNIHDLAAFQRRFREEG